MGALKLESWPAMCRAAWHELHVHKCVSQIHEGASLGTTYSIAESIKLPSAPLEGAIELPIGGIFKWLAML